jgi:hypothetical protein
MIIEVIWAWEMPHDEKRRITKSGIHLRILVEALNLAVSDIEDAA